MRGGGGGGGMWGGHALADDERLNRADASRVMSMAFFDREQTGRLVARMTSDIDSVQDLIQQGLVAFVTNALLLLCTAVLLVTLAPVLAAVCLVSLPIVIIASVRFQRSSNKAY